MSVLKHAWFFFSVIDKDFWPNVRMYRWFSFCRAFKIIFCAHSVLDTHSTLVSVIITFFFCNNCLYEHFQTPEISETQQSVLFPILL